MLSYHLELVLLHYYGELGPNSPVFKHFRGNKIVLAGGNFNRIVAIYLCQYVKFHPLHPFSFIFLFAYAITTKAAPFLM